MNPKKKSSTSEMMRIEAVAETLDVSVVTIRRWERLGQFPAGVMLNGSLRWRRQIVNDWIQEQETAGSARAIVAGGAR